MVMFWGGVTLWVFMVSTYVEWCTKEHFDNMTVKSNLLLFDYLQETNFKWQLAIAHINT